MIDKLAGATGRTTASAHGPLLGGSVQPLGVHLQATIGGKVAQSIKETPNSVSVLTRQQMDDQNVTTIQDALRYVTGVRFAQQLAE